MSEEVEVGVEGQDQAYWVEKVMQARWPTGWRCPACDGARHAMVSARSNMVQCKTKGCRVQRSVLSGTILERTHVPLAGWAYAMRAYSRPQGISSRQLARDLGVHGQTAWRMLHRIRASLVDEAPLSGECEQLLVILGVRSPCADPLVEAAILTDEAGRGRIVVGTPRCDRSLGLEGWEALDRSFRFFSRGWGREVSDAPPSSIGPARGTLLADDARVQNVARRTVGGPLRDLFKRLLERLVFTYRGVSGRWLARYTGACPAIYRGTATLESVLASCLARERSTFVALTPAAIERPYRRTFDPNRAYLHWWQQ